MKMQAMPDAETISGLMENLPQKAPKNRARLTGAIIAAATIFTVGAGAVSVTAAPPIFTANLQGNIYHSEALERMFDTTDFRGEIEKTPITGFNDKYRITLDNTFFDGENVTMLFTLEQTDGMPLYYAMETDHGTVYLDKAAIRPLFSPDIYFKAENTFSAGYGGGVTTDEDVSGNISYTMVSFSIRSEHCNIEEKTYIKFEDRLSTDDRFNNIILCTDIKENISKTVLYSADERAAELSQLWFYIHDYDVNVGLSDTVAYMIRNDGTKELIDTSSGLWVSDDGELALQLDKMIVLDDYSGVELNGVQYLK